MSTTSHAAEVNAFGQLLRQWRDSRRMSQLDLAVEAEVSSKHVSFLETGRSSPSRDMVLRLAEVLDVPLRERNSLLQAAGFASVYSEISLDSPELSTVRRSIEFLIERHEPYPAIVCDRHWYIELQNRAAGSLLSWFVEPGTFDPPFNSFRLLFHPGGLRPWVVNFRDVGAAMIQRLHREASLQPNDEVTGQLLAETLDDRTLPADWRFHNLDAELPVVLPLHLKKGDIELRLFTALTTLGTALDVTLNELRIETFLPADEATEQLLRSQGSAA